jgi:hypothetical protein
MERDNVGIVRHGKKKADFLVTKNYKREIKQQQATSYCIQ